mgnify:CR=1 FL=1
MKISRPGVDKVKAWFSENHMILVSAPVLMGLIGSLILLGLGWGRTLGVMGLGNWD